MTQTMAAHALQDAFFRHQRVAAGSKRDGSAAEAQLLAMRLLQLQFALGRCTPHTCQQAPQNRRRKLL